MSVEPLKVGQKFIKIEKGMKPTQKTQEQVSENKAPTEQTYMYNNQNGNIDVDVFMDKLLKKLSTSSLVMGKNIYDDSVINPIEVDIKKEIYIDKLDDNQVTVDTVVEGKVNNKLDKLRALRKR